MPDYREHTTEATTWRRAHAVTIDNPLPGQGVPTIHFYEVDCVRVGERIVTTPATNNPLGLHKVFVPTEEFDLLNPENGEPLGKMTHGALYVALYSLYMQLAKARDLAEAPVNSQPQSEPPTP